MLWQVDVPLQERDEHEIISASTLATEPTRMYTQSDRDRLASSGTLHQKKCTLGARRALAWLWATRAIEAQSEELRVKHSALSERLKELRMGQQLLTMKDSAIVAMTVSGE